MKKRINELEAHSRMDNIHGVTESYAGVTDSSNLKRVIGRKRTAVPQFMP